MPRLRAARPLRLRPAPRFARVLEESYGGSVSSFTNSTGDALARVHSPRALGPKGPARWRTRPARGAPRRTARSWVDAHAGGHLARGRAPRRCSPRPSAPPTRTATTPPSRPRIRCTSRRPSPRAWRCTWTARPAPPRTACASRSTSRDAPLRSPPCCRCSRTWASPPRRAPYACAPRADGVRESAARHGAETGTATSSELRRRASSRLLRRGVDGRRRERRLQPLWSLRRPRLARGDDPARLLPLPASGRHRPSASPTWTPRSRATPAIARELVDLFHLRFDPAREPGRRERDARPGAIRSASTARWTPSPNLDEDRILRRSSTLIEATLRTNFYQTAPRDGEPPAAILAFKLDSRAWTTCRARARSARSASTAPRVEGIHLRGAPIARGGIRWSDRAQDFRTEVLGLVQGAEVKNAVIVPAGAKGGFVPKQLPRIGTATSCRRRASPPTRRSSRRCSTSPTTSTDGRIVPPPRVVRHDGDDPYLVVAADKGTATFSDIANAISRGVRLLARRRLRLGRLGRLRPQGDGHHGARRLGVRQAPLPRDGHRHPDDSRSRVVGVGDMSGDVFGNGMLLSPTIRLRRRLRPPPHLHRSRSRSGDELRRAQAPVRPAALELAGLRQGADLQRRRRVLARTPSRSRCRPRCSALLGLDGDRADAGRADPRHPASARSICSGSAASAPTCTASTETDAEVGDRANDARARHRHRAARQGGRRGRQPRRDPARRASSSRRAAAASTPTSSTTRPAWTPPTRRSTSRSRSGRRSRAGKLDAERAQRAARRR